MDRLEGLWQSVMTWFRLSEGETLGSLILSLVGVILVIMLAITVLVVVVRALTGRRKARGGPARRL